MKLTAEGMLDMRKRATDGREHEWGWYVDDVPRLLDEIARIRGTRRPKASDIPDVDILHAVERQCVARGCWTNTSEVARDFSWLPFKVVQAKLGRLFDRGLVTGCPCGCRGDWELTSKGRALAGIESPWRPNVHEEAGT